LINAILQDSPRPPALLNERVSAEFSRIVLKCLNKDPKNRYPSASALALDLRALAARSTFTARPRIARWQIAFLALMFVAILGGAVSLDSIRNLFTRPVDISSLAVLPLDNLSGIRNRNTSRMESPMHSSRTWRRSRLCVWFRELR